MVTRKKMPPRRQLILTFLQEFYSDNGIPPTVRDIQRACEISSTSVVDYNLEKLKDDERTTLLAKTKPHSPGLEWYKR